MASSDDDFTFSQDYVMTPSPSSSPPSSPPNSRSPSPSPPLVVNTDVEIPKWLKKMVQPGKKQYHGHGVARPSRFVGLGPSFISHVEEIMNDRGGPGSWMWKKIPDLVQGLARAPGGAAKAVQDRLSEEEKAKLAVRKLAKEQQERREKAKQKLLDVRREFLAEQAQPKSKKAKKSTASPGIVSGIGSTKASFSHSGLQLGNVEGREAVMAAAAQRGVHKTKPMKNGQARGRHIETNAGHRGGKHPLQDGGGKGGKKGGGKEVIKGGGDADVARAQALHAYRMLKAKTKNRGHL